VRVAGERRVRDGSRMAETRSDSVHESPAPKADSSNSEGEAGGKLRCFFQFIFAHDMFV